MEKPSKIKAIFLALRVPFLQVTIASILLGFVIAWYHGYRIDLTLAILTLIGACLMHLSVNIFHEYFDWKIGTDNINVKAIRPFTGGSGMIQIGALSPMEELSIGVALMALASIIGFYIFYIIGNIMILILGLIGIFSIIFYTAPPINFSSRGLGELVVSLNFGPLMALGGYIVQTNTFSLEPLLAGLILGILTGNILIINEFPDFEADYKTGKLHLIARLGLEKGSKFFFAMMILIYVLHTIFTIFGYFPILSLVVFLTFPMAVKVAGNCIKNYNNPRGLVPSIIGTIKVHMIYSILFLSSYIISFYL